MIGLQPVRAAAIAALLLLAAVPSQAALDIDLAGRAAVGDDTDLFFAISSRYLGQDRSVVEHWSRRYAHPDDASVALFVARHARQAPAFVFKLREQGMSWWDISVRFGVKTEVWFPRTQRPPGPPYGKAYGYWAKHRHDPGFRFVLTDDDVRNLVAARMLHDYYGLSAAKSMELRAGGKDIRSLMNQEYRRRHAKAGKVAAKSHPGKGAKRGHKKR